MSIIDRERIAAVRAMKAPGRSFDGLEWNAPSSDVGREGARPRGPCHDLCGQGRCSPMSSRVTRREP